MAQVIEYTAKKAIISSISRGKAINEALLARSARRLKVKEVIKITCRL